MARSLPDAREILENLTRREVKLSIGAWVHDPTDPSADCSSTCWRWSRSPYADLIRLRTKEGMRVAEAKGRPRGNKQPKLNPRQEAHVLAPHHAGEHSIAELGDLFRVNRSTVYRAIQRDTRRPHERVIAGSASFVGDR